MGRKPNFLVARYFDRGRKLQDNSNRYGHTCRLCKMRFPKGRFETLMKHIIHHCRFISNPDRIAACLEFNQLVDPHGTSPTATSGPAIHPLQPGRGKTARQVAAGGGGPSAPRQTASRPVIVEKIMAGQTAAASANANAGTPVDAPARDWSGLETLAEASRQVDLGDNHAHPHGNIHQRQQLADNNQADNDVRGRDRQSSEEQHLAQYLNMAGEFWTGTGTENESALAATAAAAAAAARLLPTLHDSQLQHTQTSTDHSSHPSSRPSSPQSPHAFHPRLPATSVAPPVGMDLAHAHSPVAADSMHLATSSPAPAIPWEQANIITTNPQAPAQGSSLPPGETLPRGGSRMDTSKPARCKFEPSRRQEVRKNRQNGACWRCRLLRKPCDSTVDARCGTCEQVVNPRVWRWGCVRARLHEKLELYSVGMHAETCRKQILHWTADPGLMRHDGTIITAGLVVARGGAGGSAPTFIHDGDPMKFEALSVVFSPRDMASSRPTATVHPVMLDGDKHDIPAELETYMLRALTPLIQREPSHFARTVLLAATRSIGTAPDAMTGAVLQRVLHLWSYVEIMDREADWHLVATPPAESGIQPYVITRPDGLEADDLYALFGMQLSEAAERKAAAEASDALKSMQTLLLDAHTAVGLHMYLAVLILLICVERTTWALRAWERTDAGHPGPLERPLAALASQGHEVTDLLQKVMTQRRLLVGAALGDLQRLIVDEEGKGGWHKAKGRDNEEIVEFVNGLMLSYFDVKKVRDNPQINHNDPRSLELSLCSHILMPKVI